MISKVRGIFLDNGFQEKEYDFGYLYKLSPEAGKEVYWLLSNRDFNSVLDKQSEYFNICKNDIAIGSFAKNCNLLILEKINSDKDNSKLFNHILDVEEDPYIFRKYILYYTEDELTELEGIIDGENFNSFITRNASEPSFFDKYKKSENMFNGYSLLYRLMIKLPFLEIRSNEEELDDLKRQMREVLIENGLDKDYEIVSGFLSDKSIEEITSTDPAKILEKVLSSFGGELNDKA